MNWNGEINWDTKPPRHGEIYWLNSSQEKIQKFTGWKSKIPYNEGIDKTIEIWEAKLRKEN
jgi:dTDP-D-glucose 4,6-dehydratase